MDKNLDSQEDYTIDHRKKIDELHSGLQQDKHFGGIESQCGGKNETKSGSCGPKGLSKEAKRCDKMEDEPMDKRRESDVRNKEISYQKAKMDKNLDSHKEFTMEDQKKIDDMRFGGQQDKHFGGVHSKCGGKNETKGGSCGDKGQCKEGNRCDKMEDEPMDKRRESDVRNKEM
ncbi:hypothetical protein L5515_009111 [Caenorhabditis briggsae]|uniref:Uncharacterized protein n=1 Tax=Caenorhabditis briggsae TaxID=6238 RepID=A0AAE9F805_CAEBR|nr:hypothetical protein L5515_009111 [Caenorhabditis briggsae]